MKAGLFTAFIVLLFVILGLSTKCERRLLSPETESDPLSVEETAPLRTQKVGGNHAPIEPIEVQQRPSLDQLDPFTKLRDELLVQSLSGSKVLKDLTLGFARWSADGAFSLKKRNETAFVSLVRLPV